MMSFGLNEMQRAGWGELRVSEGEWGKRERERERVAGNGWSGRFWYLGNVSGPHALIGRSR